MKSEGILISKTCRVSRHEWATAPTFVEQRTQENMRMAVADFIACERAVKSESQYHIDFTLDLYVATPDQFWQAVQDEAHKLAFGRI